MAWIAGRWVGALAFIGLLAACHPKGLSRAPLPVSGVEVGYHLTPGQLYSGRIVADTAYSHIGYDSSLSVEFSVDLVVHELHEGRHAMLATIHDVEAIDATTAPATTPGKLSDGALAALEGLELTFYLSDDGTLTGLDGDGAPPGCRSAFRAIRTALRSSFATLPRTVLHGGEVLDVRSPDPSDTASGWTVELTGMFRDGHTGEGVARLQYVRDAPMGVFRKRHEVGAVLFSMDGFPLRLDIKRESRHDLISIYTDVHTEWHKVGPSPRST